MKNKILIACILFVTLFTGCKEDDNAAPRPTANFDFSNCEAPCTVNFINISQNATSYNWNFGDGTTSTEVNPKHLYENAGTYNVTLQAAGEGGSHTREKQVVISTPIPHFRYKMDGITIDAQTIIATRNIPVGFMDLRSYNTFNLDPYLQFQIAEPDSGFKNGMTILLNQSTAIEGTIATFKNGDEYTTSGEPTGMTMNITTVNYTNGGIITGTFSGIVKTNWGGIVLITDGTFKMMFSN
jgi:PKD repeat protein